MADPQATNAGSYSSGLATVLHGSALPYGYTVTVWTSGIMLVRHHGLPTTGEVFLFMAGAIAAFGVLGGVVSLIGADPRQVADVKFRQAGTAHFLAVGGALGAATLIALWHSVLAWPLGAFAATATYMALAAVQLVVVGRRASGADRR
jgi:hypothetical protein